MSIEALVRERAHYLARGRKDRAAQVDAELARLNIAVEDDKPETTRESAPRETATPAKPRPTKKA